MFPTTKPSTIDSYLADWTHTMRRSVLRHMLAVVSRPGILSFAGGLPAPELFPTEDYAHALQRVLAQDANALQYGPPFPCLKRHIVQLMAQRGIDCGEAQIFITTGAQQGLNTLTRLLLNPGDDVVLEEIVYTGVQQVIAPYRPNTLPVSTDLQTGLDVDAVERYLLQGHRPAYLYLIPDAHNPLGVSLSPDKRRRLATIASHYGLPIIEDDPYGFLAYDGPPAPPLRAHNEAWVFYVGSFSKILAPALRLGWLVAPEALLQKLTVVKEMDDLESSQLTQRAVAAYLEAGKLPDHLARLRVEYGRRRDAMLAALARHFPAEARWTEPSNGMFVWVELPVRVDTEVLLETAVFQEQVAFIPGHAFTLPGIEKRNCLRLNFSNCTPERIDEGIARLGRIVEQAL